VVCVALIGQLSTLRQSLETELTFRPLINKDVAVVDESSVFERLLQPAVSPEKQHRLEVEVFRECTHTPVLCTASYKIATAVVEAGVVP
jgi:hypothetical protein